MIRKICDLRTCEVCKAEERVVSGAPFIIILACEWCNIVMCRGCRKQHTCTGKKK